MKSFQQIKQAVDTGDYKRVARIVEKSESLVKQVVAQTRADHHNIQKVFSDLLEQREWLAAREAKRRARKHTRQAA